MTLIPACGQNEKVNAGWHAALVFLYVGCLLYHGRSVIDHWRRRGESVPH